ncbi:MAG: hypothetical protein AABZ60_09965 [Planctomycetota bacterium]
MPPILQNLLLWLFLLAFIFYIRWRRKPHLLSTFHFLPDEKILWTERKVEVTQIRKRPAYKTFDLTITNQRLLFAQLGYCEEIWDYTNSHPPEAFRFYGIYLCIPKSQIYYEQTFRGQKTLKLTSLSLPKITYLLDLTKSEQNYSSIFGD